MEENGPHRSSIVTPAPPPPAAATPVLLASSPLQFLRFQSAMAIDLEDAAAVQRQHVGARSAGQTVTRIQRRHRPIHRHISRTTHHRVRAGRKRECCH
jgi:hypothetical protein